MVQKIRVSFDYVPDLDEEWYKDNGITTIEGALEFDKNCVEDEEAVDHVPVTDIISTDENPSMWEIVEVDD